MEQEFACTKFARIDVTNPAEVAHFIEWLCGDRRPSLSPEELAESFWEQPEEVAELLWGWDAPRHRMAKLLWQLLQGNDDEDYFRNQFTLITSRLVEDAARCAEILPPIQEKLRWVLEGFRLRCEQDREIGQGAWGEEWWLPPEQAEFVRSQIRRARLDLLERGSDYEEATEMSLWLLARHGAKAIDTPCNDPGRAYEGRREIEQGAWPGTTSLVSRVYVTVADGRRWLLKNVKDPEMDGIFDWGYGGHGSAALAESILADALDGDLDLAQRFTTAFFEEFVLRWPMGQPFRITRAEVLRWLEGQGLTEQERERARKAQEERRARYEAAIRKREARLLRMREITPQGLRRQRFDLVPPDFECALYLDPKAMLESSFVLLRCAHCGLPIPCGASERSQRQLALSRRGVPVYHPECHEQHRREVKRQYYRRRAQDEAYREARRLRAREARRLTGRRGAR